MEETKSTLKLRNVLYAAAFFVVITAAFITGLMMTPPVRRYGNATFNEVFDYLLNSHYSQPDAERLWQGAIYGMISSLDDPFTRYFDEADYSRYRQGFGESFVGIGISAENYNEKVLIRTVWPGSPAEEAGLMAGDIITHVDGIDYTQSTFNETTAAIIGEVGTTVEVGFERAGFFETLYVTMTRAVIENPSVEIRPLDISGKTFGHLVIHAFGDETQDLVADGLDYFDMIGIDGLIIDVRDNGGGNLTTLVSILDIFLSKETTTLPLFTLRYLEDGQWVDEVYRPNNTSMRDYPVTVLVNGQSASASEVFAAAMKEYGGHTIIGETTYGKGTFQSSLPLQTIRGDRLNITMGLWLTPEGNWVHFDGGTEGFEPDIIVEQNPYFNLPMLFFTNSEHYTFDQVSTRIMLAQQMLNAVYGLSLRTDGYFDLNTETAVINFQISQSLTPNGILTAETASRLSEAIRAYQQATINDQQLTAAVDYLLTQLDS